LKATILIVVLGIPALTVLWLAEGRTQEETPAAAFGPVPDSPVGLIRRLEWAYENRKLADYADLFTSDFRFYFCDPELIDRYPTGWSRDDEIASARHLFEGFVNDDGEYRPAAEAIELTMKEIEVHSVPSRADSTAFYRKVRVPSVRLIVHLPGDDLFVEGQPHEFWVVRGDAAALVDGQAPSLDRWYVYKWVESPAESAPPEEKREGQDGAEPVALDATRQGLRFALHPIHPNPSLQPLYVSFVLATSEVSVLQIYDVRGRMRFMRSVGQLGPGRHRVRAGERLGPGVYWIRLRQGDRSASTKVTILR
jgi:hypothetical protein